MSRDFKGKNNLTSANAFYYWRAKFANKAHGGLGHHVLKDFNFAERQHYGLLDTNGDPVVPIEDKMLPIANPRDPHNINYAFDFVTHMFIDLKAHIETAVLSGMICADSSIIAQCSPVKSYVPPRIMYESYLDTMLATFVRTTIPKIYGLSNIMNFESFVKYFLNYIRDYFIGEPVTFSGWLISKKSTYYNSGLAISIADLEIDSDQEKIDELIDDPAFSMFKTLTMGYGFSLAFNGPWNLVADLANPAIAKYYQIYNVSSIQNLFDTYYTKAYYNDILILKNKLIQFYNIFAELNKRQIKFSFKKNVVHTLCKGKTKWSFQERAFASIGLINLRISEDYWLDYLLDLKNYENKQPFKRGQLLQMKIQAKKIRKVFDNTSALDYINNETKGFIYKRDFGFRYLYERLQEREVQDRIDKGITGKTVFGGSSGGGY